MCVLLQLSGEVGRVNEFVCLYQGRLEVLFDYSGSGAKTKELITSKEGFTNQVDFSIAISFT
jgi:hypothetical protein